jgi:hypothetical protein
MEENPGIVRLAGGCVTMNRGGEPMWEKPDAQLVAVAPVAVHNPRAHELDASFVDLDRSFTAARRATDLGSGRLAEQAPAGRATGRADGR